MPSATMDKPHRPISQKRQLAALNLKGKRTPLCKIFGTGKVSDRTRSTRSTITTVSIEHDIHFSMTNHPLNHINLNKT